MFIMIIGEILLGSKFSFNFLACLPWQLSWLFPFPKTKYDLGISVNKVWEKVAMVHLFLCTGKLREKTGHVVR